MKCLLFGFRVRLNISNNIILKGCQRNIFFLFQTLTRNKDKTLSPKINLFIYDFLVILG